MGDNKKEQLRKYEKKGKNVAGDNLDDEKKEHLKKSERLKRKRKA